MCVCASCELLRCGSVCDTSCLRRGSSWRMCSKIVKFQECLELWRELRSLTLSACKGRLVGCPKSTWSASFLGTYGLLVMES